MFHDQALDRPWCRMASGLLVLLVVAQVAVASSTERAAGIADRTPKTFALTHARVVARPGKVIKDATVLVRDGRIVSVGHKLAVPAGVAATDLAGRSVCNRNHGPPHFLSEGSRS